MKTLLLAAALASTPTAPADGLDFASFYCRDYIPRIVQTAADSEGAQSVHLIHFWLYGYVSGKAGNTALSKPVASAFVEKLIRECEARPDQSVLQAAEAAYSAAGGG